VDEKTKADSLAILLTNESAFPAEITDDESLGGYTSNKYADKKGFYVSGNLIGVEILRLAGPEGIGSIEAVDENNLRFTAPSGIPGAAVTIANNETKMLEDGTEPAYFAVVKRKTIEDLKGSLTINIVAIYNNVFGMSNISGAEQQAGENKLRCIALKNVHASLSITNLKVWIKTLGTQRVSDIDQLGASGAGTIETAGSLADWPLTGFCRIETAAGSLREIVYYSNRNSVVITVPAAGRALLGTSSAAGTATDKIYPIPGVKIASESPDGNGLFSIADDENDIEAVSGLSWTTGIIAANGLNIGSMASNAKMGCWIWLVVPVGQTAAATLENSLSWSWTLDTIDYTGEASGLYRVADDTITGYELYRGVDAEPDLSASPWETFTTLPHESAALAVSHTYKFVLRYRNKFNLCSQNIESWQVEIDAEGNEVQPVPAAPLDITIIPAAAGTAIVEARYFYEVDAEYYEATDWLIYFTDDDSDPDPDNDTPVVVAMTKSNGIARLNWQSPAADNEDILKVIVRTRRTVDEIDFDSTNTAIYSTIAETEGPEKVEGKALFAT
jgi:hypothetical protein